MSGGRNASLTPAQWAIVEPYARELRAMYRSVEGLSDADLAVLRDACSTAAITNDWAIYRVSRILLVATSEQIYRRGRGRGESRS